MHDPLIFRAKLTMRILGVLGVASLGLPQACSSGSAAIAATSTGGATSSGATTKSTTMTSTGTAPHDAGTGGVGTGGAAPGGANAGGAGGAGGGSQNPPTMACFDWPLVLDGGADAADAAAIDAGPPGPCPTDYKVALTDFLALLCPAGWEPYKIVSGPTATASQCCYEVYELLCTPGGRPFLVNDAARVAPIVGGGRGWSRAVDRTLESSDANLTANDRALLADAWANDAAMEHASVASFSRFSLALLAAGAPAELVELAHRAALDELRHARLCFALASRYRGETLGPGPFPIEAGVHVEADLASLAVSTVREGCLGETVAAVVAAEQLARASDPAVRAALLEIAEDEARHALLAWKTVAWAIRVGGAPVRAAVECALVDVLSPKVSPSRVPGEASAKLEAHGQLDAFSKASTIAGAIANVVVPAARALLGARQCTYSRIS
jgi:hypothetical protein